MYSLSVPPPGNWSSGTPPAVSLSLGRSTLRWPLQRSTTLSWSIANTRTCLLSSSLYATPIPVTTSGKMKGDPPGAGGYTFTLSCAERGLTGQASAQLEVIN